MSILGNWTCGAWRRNLFGMVSVFDSLTRLTIKGPQKMKWIVTHQTVKSEDYAWIPQATLWNHLRGHWHQGGTQQTTGNNPSILENCTIKTLKAVTKTGGCILGVCDSVGLNQLHLSWKETLYQGTWCWSSWISDLGGWGLEKFSRAWICVKIENSRDKFLRMSFSEHYINMYILYMYASNMYCVCIHIVYPLHFFSWTISSSSTWWFPNKGLFSKGGVKSALQDPQRAIFPEVPVASSGGAMVGGPGPSATWCRTPTKPNKRLATQLEPTSTNGSLVWLIDEGVVVFCAFFCGAVFQISRPPQNPDAQNWNIECVFQLRIHLRYISWIYLTQDSTGKSKVYVDFQTLKMFHWKILGGDERLHPGCWEGRLQGILHANKKNPTSGKQICDWWLSRPGFVGNLRALDVAVLFLVDGHDATFPQLWQVFKKHNQKVVFDPGAFRLNDLNLLFFTKYGCHPCR